MRDDLSVASQPPQSNSNSPPDHAESVGHLPDTPSDVAATRRTFIKAGLAGVPMILTFSSRSAWAQATSGNASPVYGEQAGAPAPIAPPAPFDPFGIRYRRRRRRRRRLQNQ